MIKKLLSTALLLAHVGLPTQAQDQFGIPVSGEFLTGWQQADGTRVAAVKLTLEDGWKTYWRAPGDTGIPPHFDWSGSANLRGIGIQWPAPSVFREPGLTTIGYKNELILPITVAPRENGKPVKLNAILDIGVCSDVCVPQRLQIDVVLDSTASRPTPAIAAALAQRPFSASEAGVHSATCTLRPTDRGFEIRTQVTVPSAGGRELVVIEAGQPDIWVSETDTTRSGRVITSIADMEHTGGGTFGIDRSAVRITVLGSKHAVDIRGCTPG